MAVPDLTSVAGIKLNARVSLRGVDARLSSAASRAGYRSAEGLKKRSHDVTYQIATVAVIVAFVVIMLLFRR
jgi:hypothetical protein